MTSRSGIDRHADSTSYNTPNIKSASLLELCCEIALSRRPTPETRYIQNSKCNNYQPGSVSENELDRCVSSHQLQNKIRQGRTQSAAISTLIWAQEDREGIARGKVGIPCDGKEDYSHSAALWSSLAGVAEEIHYSKQGPTSAEDSSCEREAQAGDK